MAKFNSFLITFAIAIACGWYTALVLSTVWQWFAVIPRGAPPISVFEAWLAMVALQVATAGHARKSQKFAEAVANSLIGTTTLLAFAWVIRAVVY